MPINRSKASNICIVCGNTRYNNEDGLCGDCRWNKHRRDRRLKNKPDNCKCEECGKGMKNNKYSLDKCIKCLGGTTEYYRIVREIKAKQEAEMAEYHRILTRLINNFITK